MTYGRADTTLCQCPLALNCNISEKSYQTAQCMLKTAAQSSNIGPLGAQLLLWPRSALAKPGMGLALNLSAQIHPGCVSPE